MTESRAGRQVGRGAKVRAAVLAATLAELDATGYTALTVEKVAERAGVHKTTLYRRWIDRESLVVDALTEQTAADVPIPDTGTLAGDLGALADALVTTLTSPHGRAVTAALTSDATRVAEIGAIMDRFFADRFRRGEPVVARAIARGEVPAGTDHVELLTALIAPVHFRVLIGQAVTADTAARAAAATLAAARAGAYGTADGA